MSSIRFGIAPARTVRGFAELEDCCTLEIRRYQADEPWDMKLRPVRRSSP